jgi:hypothetical protein
MKQIIRSNAVETINQRSRVGKKISNFYSRQIARGKLLVLPRINLSVLPRGSDIEIKNKSNRLASFPQEVLSAFPVLVWGGKLDFLPKIVLWVCREKMLQINTTLIIRSIERIKTRFWPDYRKC